MNILALDLSRCVGHSYGRVGTKPSSGVFELRRPSDDVHFEPYELYRQLGMYYGALPIDHVVCELYMSPAAQRNERAIVSQLIVHGSLDVWCGQRRLPLTRISANNVRIEICGRPSAQAPVGTRWSREQQRSATKRMVRDRVIELGLADQSVTDDNQTDAIAVWKWAEMTIGGAPRVFVLS